MMKRGDVVRPSVNVFFKYSTLRIIVIRSFKVGTLNRITQALVIAYVIRSGLLSPPPVPPTSPPPPPPASGSGALRLALPREYDGAAAGCQGFLLQLELYLATVRPTPSGEESVSVLVSCLTGRALEWANAVWNGPDSARDHYPEFSGCPRTPPKMPLEQCCFFRSIKHGESPSGAGVFPIHDLAKFLRSPSSNSSVFFKALPTKQSFAELGELEWEEERKEMDSMFLTKSRTHIQVTESGWYLVFVQVTFKLPAGKETRHLMLRLDFTYSEQTDQIASAFDTRQLLDEEQDAPLSFSVLVWVGLENRLSVLASHRALIDYERRPVSTCITIIRCSD